MATRITTPGGVKTIIVDSHSNPDPYESYQHSIAISGGPLGGLKAQRYGGIAMIVNTGTTSRALTSGKEVIIGIILNTEGTNESKACPLMNVYNVPVSKGSLAIRLYTDSGTLTSNPKIAHHAYIVFIPSVNIAAGDAVSINVPYMCRGGLY